MKTLIKSILYFSFAALVFTGCAKNDDFSIPTIVDPAAGLKETKSIEDIYKFITPTIAKYEADDIIKGIIVSTDKEQTFFKEIYFVDEQNNKAGVFKLDKYSTFVDYEIGSTVYIKLKDTYVQLNNGILSIGGQNGKFVGYLADPIYKKHIFASNKNVLSLKELEENYLTEVTLKEVIESNGKDHSFIGKLIRIKDVQFDSEARGKTFVRNGESATFNIIESREAVVNPLQGKIGFRVASQNKVFSNKIVDNNSGTMTGVMTIFNKDFQFIPRFTSDLKLDQDPFKVEGGTDPEVPVDPNIKVEPGKYLAFPGADFKDWKAFEGAMNKYGLEFAVQSKGQGWANSDALELKGTPEKTGYTFTIDDVKVPTGATELSFLMKGTADARSLSINVFQADGTFVAYNVGAVVGSKRVEKSKINTEEQFVNNYEGVIDTKGEWVKIILNLKGFNYNTTGKGNFIAFKHGGATKTIASKYDLIIDEIRFEDGTPADGGTDPVDPVDPEVPEVGNILSSFDVVNGLEWINSKYAVVEAGKGLDGKSKGLVINGDRDKADTAYRLSNVKVPADAKKITLKLKGTSKGRSLVFNVLDKEVKSNFFSLKDVKSDVTLTGEGSKNTYTGNIDTNNKWITVTLNLPAGNVNNTNAGKFFEIRLGGKENNVDSNYDLVIDDIVFE